MPPLKEVCMTSICTLAPLLLALPFAAPPPVGAARLQMFVTSVAGSGELSSWDDAGTLTGLAAGDAICQARATAAALPNPATYRAWLSDDTDDAYCRLHGLSGKKSANCGEATLPATAGPWWRTDGKPFAGTLHDLLHPWFQVLEPPRFDELGAEIPLPTDAWTGTNSQGAVDAQTCANWTSPATDVDGGYGLADRTSRSWAAGWTGSCDGARHLYCFETGAGDPLPVFPANRPLAFLTSAFGYGDLAAWPLAGGETGIAAGDRVCQLLAIDAGVRDPDSFKAWLSDASASAASRFVYPGPWVRLDGMWIAASLAELTGGELQSSIHVLETGAYQVSVPAWTGTLAGGSADPSTCAGWHSASATDDGRYGSSNATLSNWTEHPVLRSCDAVLGSLYCLQDTPLLFFDDFESGALYAWTSRVPNV